MVAHGTSNVDLFMGVPRTSSSLLEGGLSEISEGMRLVNAGAAFLRGGVATLVGSVGLVGSYFGTSYLICKVDPNYGN